MAEYIEIPDGGIGEVSDGHHTFNSLYRQRLILTAALVKAHKAKVDNVRSIYMDRMRETWERMRRGEPDPDPGPSNCEYITFEGMYY